MLETSSSTSNGVDDKDFNPSELLFNGTTSEMSESELKGFVTDHPDLWFYQAVYMTTVGVMLVFGLIKGFSIAVFFLRGSTRMHDKMLHRLELFLYYILRENEFLFQCYEESDVVLRCHPDRKDPQQVFKRHG